MSEVRLVVAILVPAIFTLILKDFFDLFMTNRYVHSAESSGLRCVSERTLCKAQRTP